MNNFARSIGIWYHDRKWAEELFWQVLEEIPRYSLFRIYKNSLKIQLTDGTSIRFFGTDCGKRAIALTESYIQEGIDKDFFYEKICTVTKYGTKGLFIINNYDDIRFPKVALKYYNKVV